MPQRSGHPVDPSPDDEASSSDPRGFDKRTHTQQPSPSPSPPLPLPTSHTLGPPPRSFTRGKKNHHPLTARFLAILRTLYPSLRLPLLSLFVSLLGFVVGVLVVCTGSGVFRGRSQGASIRGHLESLNKTLNEILSTHAHLPRIIAREVSSHTLPTPHTTPPTPRYSDNATRVCKEGGEMWHWYGDHQGPCDVCGYTPLEVETILNIPHSCHTHVWESGAWRHWENVRDEERERDASCVIICTRYLPCPVGRCVWPLFIRPGVSDVSVVHQLFGEGQVRADESLFISHTPVLSVLDAGANIGCAAVYYALRYPEALIVALEPAEHNYEVLVMNTRRLENVVTMNKGLWRANSILCVPKHDRWDSWGFQVEECGREGGKDGASQVRGRTIGTSISSLLKNFGLRKFDLVKIDVEGSEGVIFDESSDTKFLEDSLFLVVEPHGEEFVKIVNNSVSRVERWKFQGFHHEYLTWSAL